MMATTLSFKLDLLTYNETTNTKIYTKNKISIVRATYKAFSVTRSGDLLDFGQLLNAFGNN